MDDATNAFQRFMDVIRTLRAPYGCPWDREQTPQSMRADLIEETFEAVDAITANDTLHAKEELGDVMLNAAMISYMYEQNGDFTVADVFNELADKLIRRHPHVFKESEGQSEAKESVDNAEKVLSQWDRIKENVEGRKSSSILDEVPESFPPLLRAYKLSKKAAKKGFDWPNADGVREKVLEEWSEVQCAIAGLECAGAENIEPIAPDSEISAWYLDGGLTPVQKAKNHLEEEIGDLFFALTNYARHLGVNPDIALARANKKFYDRFSYVEKKMAENGVEMAREKLAENFELMDGFWNEAKKNSPSQNETDCLSG